MTLASHLFVGDNGDLYDTRDPQWSANPPLRLGYAADRHAIYTVAHLKSALRSGPYAFPGGYPLFFMTSDGSVLSYKAVKLHLAEVYDSIQTETDDGWRVDCCQLHQNPDEIIYCDVLNQPI